LTAKIIILMFFFYHPFSHTGQTHRKGSLSKGRRGSNPGEEPEKDEFTPAQKHSQQPPQKLEGKVAKMIEKAEQRRQKRIARQREVRL